MGIPLATIGFTIAGLFFAIYGGAISELTQSRLPTKFKSYANAYFFLATAFFIWAAAASLGDLLTESVLIGNILILAGSIFMLNFIFADSDRRAFVLVVGILLSFVFFYLRLAVFIPQPEIINGILVFNTDLPIALLLAGIFGLIWLPANLRAAKILAQAGGQSQLQGVYSIIHIATIVCALLFISFRDLNLVVLSFIGLSLCFLTLMVSILIIRGKLNKVVKLLSALASTTPSKHWIYTIPTWLAGGYVFLVFASFTNQLKALDGILALVTVIFSAFVGTVVLTKVLDASKGNALVKLLAFIVGLVLGGIVFIIGAIAALVSSLKHFQGD